MALTVLYCTRDDVKKRLSRAGLLNFVDDDKDGELSDKEWEPVDQAIGSTAREINAALAPFFNLPFTQEESTLNGWLRDRAYEIAVDHLAGRKGREVPASVADTAKRARDMLDMVRKGDMAVPQLLYPSQRFPIEQSRMGLPRVANPRKGRR